MRGSTASGMAPPPQNKAPAVHPVVREVTEDTPPDLLEGMMDLLVILPSKKSQRMTVSRKTPIMDLLIQVATANKIVPAGHIVQVKNERGIELPYKPSTPIGALDTTTIEIVPKNQVNEYIIVKKQPAKLANQPFEQTFRLQVHLPRKQLYVMRVSPKTILNDILQEVCQEKNLDISKYEIRHPVNLEEKLPLKSRVGDFGLQELTVVSRNSRINSSVSTADIMALQEEGRTKGCLDSAFKHSRSSVGDSSVSSESALSGRGNSPSRSDDSRSISPLPPLRPKLKLSNSVSNASSSSGTSSALPKAPVKTMEGTTGKPKKRAAPLPPTPQGPPLKDSFRDDGPEGKMTPKKKEPPKDPPRNLPINHSRQSSDSSGYHESSLVSEQQEIHSRASGGSPLGMVPKTNLTTVSSVSSTSLASSNGGLRKRKAPKPPGGSSGLPAQSESPEEETTDGESSGKERPIRLGDSKAEVPISSSVSSLSSHSTSPSPLPDQGKALEARSDSPAKYPAVEDPATSASINNHEAAESHFDSTPLPPPRTKPREISASDLTQPESGPKPKPKPRPDRAKSEETRKPGAYPVTSSSARNPMAKIGIKVLPDNALEAAFLSLKSHENKDPTLRPKSAPYGSYDQDGPKKTPVPLPGLSRKKSSEPPMSQGPSTELLKPTTVERTKRPNSHHNFPSVQQGTPESIHSDSDDLEENLEFFELKKNLPNENKSKNRRLISSLLRKVEPERGSDQDGTKSQRNSQKEKSSTHFPTFSMGEESAKKPGRLDEGQLAKWQKFESLNEIDTGMLEPSLTASNNNNHHRPVVLNERRDKFIKSRDANRTKSVPNRFDSPKGDHAKEISSNVSSESEISYSDSGIPATEENATPSPIDNEKTDKDVLSLDSGSSRSSLHSEEPEYTWKDILKEKNHSQNGEKAIESMMGEEAEPELRKRTHDHDQGARDENEIRRKEAETVGDESRNSSISPLPRPQSQSSISSSAVGEDSLKDPSATSLSHPEEDEDEKIFVAATLPKKVGPGGVRKVSKSESFSHKSEFDVVKMKRKSYANGRNEARRKSYVSSSEEEEAGGKQRTSSMQNLSRAQRSRTLQGSAGGQQGNNRLSKEEGDKPRKATSVMNIRTIDPDISENPELLKAFRSELETQFEQWKEEFLQKHGKSSKSSSIDSTHTSVTSEEIKVEEETTTGKSSPLGPQEEKSEVDGKSEAVDHGEVQTQLPPPTIVETIRKDSLHPSHDSSSYDETSNDSDHFDPEKPQIVHAVGNSVPLRISPAPEDETPKMKEPIQAILTESSEESENEERAFPSQPTSPDVVIAQVENIIEPILVQDTNNNKPTSEVIQEPIEILEPIMEPVELRQHEEERKETVYRYSGPPTIQMSTWSDRPRRQVSVKKDNDYIMGMGQHDAKGDGKPTLASVVTRAQSFTSMKMNTLPAQAKLFGPSSNGEGSGKMNTPNVVSAWKAKVEEAEKERKSLHPETPEVGVNGKPTVLPILVKEERDAVKVSLVQTSPYSTMDRKVRQFVPITPSTSFPTSSKMNANLNKTSSFNGNEMERISNGNVRVSQVVTNKPIVVKPIEPPMEILNGTNRGLKDRQPLSSSERSNLSEKKQFFQGIKPVESTGKETPIPAVNLKSNIATIQKVFEQRQIQENQQRSNSLHRDSFSGKSEKNEKTMNIFERPMSSTEMVQKVLQQPTKTALENVRRTPSPAPSLSERFTTPTNPQGDSSKWKFNEVRGPLNSITISTATNSPQATLTHQNIKNVGNKSIIIVSSDQEDGGKAQFKNNEFKHQVRVSAQPTTIVNNHNNGAFNYNNPVNVPIKSVIHNKAPLPITNTINNNVKINVGENAEPRGSFYTLPSGNKKTAMTPGPPEPTPSGISGSRDLEKMVIVGRKESLGNGSVPPPPPPMSKELLKPLNIRPKSSGTANGNGVSSPTTPTSPNSDPRAEIFNVIKNSGGKFGLKKTGSTKLLM